MPRLNLMFIPADLWVDDIGGRIPTAQLFGRCYLAGEGRPRLLQLAEDPGRVFNRLILLNKSS